ncbi:hypothetical protein [Streptomyces sp. NPDC048560]|uniref:hypothetical protein n=1 Tax=Streptomyces sp. NPDC048560 TaxID=3155488 RepID=UPI003434682B
MTSGSCDCSRRKPSGPASPVVREAVRVLGADIAAGRFLVQNTLTACADLLHRNRGMAEPRELGIG